MKFKIFFISLVATIFGSCSKSDNTNTTPPLVDDGVAKFYLPLEEGKAWAYTVKSGTNPDTQDDLSVKGSETVGGVEYKKFQTTAIPNGFFSSNLNGNKARNESNTVKLIGNLTFTLIENQESLSFPISDFILVKKLANQGDVLSAPAASSFVKTISGYDLKFDYTIKSIFDGSLPSITSNGNTYNDIKKTKLILNLKITVNSGILQGSVVMKPQDVLVSTQTYSNNVGMIETNTDINYTLEDIPGITIPKTGKQNQKEFLVKK